MRPITESGHRRVVARLAQLLTIAAVIALLGSQTAAAETHRPAATAATTSPAVPLGTSAATTAQVREPTAQSAKKKKKKRKKKRKKVPRVATIGGHTDWKYASVTLQHVAGGYWVNTPGGQAGSGDCACYSHHVLTGYTYRYYVVVEFPFLVPVAGLTLNCIETRAAYSRSVSPAPGSSHPNLDTTLRSVGRRCPAP